MIEQNVLNLEIMKLKQEDQKLEQEIQKLKSMTNKKKPGKTEVSEMDMSMPEGLFNPFEKFLPMKQEVGTSTTENILVEDQDVKTTYN